MIVFIRTQQGFGHYALCNPVDGSVDNNGPYSCNDKTIPNYGEMCQ
jgi:hypothetical protein